MAARAQSRPGTIQRAFATAGLLLMAASFVWLQLLPVPPRRSGSAEGKKQTEGSISLVVIDAGHGGQDSGTMRDGILEKDLTLDVARRLEQLVRARGLHARLTRPTDDYVSLSDRAAAANREQDCVFVSIHFDEGTRAAATGVNTYYAAHQTDRGSSLPSWLGFVQPVSAQSVNFESQSLAGFVQESLVARTRAVNRGTRAEQFYVIANVRHPAVLVEGGFLTNNDDIGKLRTEEYRQQLAAAIADGIMRYREIAGEPPAAAPEEPPRA